ncbi:MAG: histidine kinase [Acidobacteria bacterium]|nr:histidine kinase [Acidobacteriota bacterium]MBI3424551.1 histidine kinase [Acidobacteriota bacterium]
MTTPAVLTNLLGFITGAALYGMLLWMVLRQPRASARQAKDGLPLLTALLGLAWNVGGLLTFGLSPVSHVRDAWFFPLLVAAAFTALGFLPAVVVHSVLRTGETWQGRSSAWGMSVAAYCLSTAASVLHFQQALALGDAPSHWALHLLTGGFALLIVALLFAARGAAQRPGWPKAGVAALAVFAVSAAHLSHHEGADYSWWVELIGHHASLALIAVILYQDYRFALADLFLKRALALMLLVAVSFGLYLTVAAPLFHRWQPATELHPWAVGLMLALWVLTALVYPWLKRAVVWLVDAVILRRADYDTLQHELAQTLADCESADAVLATVCQQLADALTAHEISWTAHTEDFSTKKTTGPLLPRIELQRRTRESAPALTNVLVPTSEAPQYRLHVGALAGGRRLLSDDQTMLETVALLAARRIDAVRVVHERCMRDLHEQEMQKLATEAELRALRAQINPHFLFNALTTIGYLIQTAPAAAVQTLLRLTALLRAVLRKGEGEFCTLGEELELIEAYLDIERARFEDRLRVVLDVPTELHNVRIPALLLQPLVENAIKHGITPLRAGGEVVVWARREASKDNTERLHIRVTDTGQGVGEQALAHGRTRGVGLANVEQRLQRHFADSASFSLRSAPGVGTTVELFIPAAAVSTNNVVPFERKAG